MTILYKGYVVIYLKFLQLRQYTLHLPYELEMILAVIAEYNAKARLEKREMIRGTELLHMKHLGSPATIHKNYQFLIGEGFVMAANNSTDRRIKHISLTPEGLNYMKKMDEILKTCKII